MKSQDKIRRDDQGHIIPNEKAGYNERLFRSGIRKNYHEARFYWLQAQFDRLKIRQGTIVELGCYDARSIQFIPYRPEKYHGYDANWENGLDLARSQWGHESGFQFSTCLSSDDFNPPVKAFDFGICLETLEHLDETQLSAYLKTLQQTVRQAVFISVPVEMGPFAVMKYLYKSLFLEVDEPYRIIEIWHLLFGNTKKIERVPLGHKGFDFRALKKTLQQYFHIESVTGLPFSVLPPGLNLSCAFVLRPLN